MSQHWASRPWKISRWRTEYPEQFPVTVTTIKPEETPMNPKDWNGHVPDDPGLSDYQRGYQQALLDLSFAMLAKIHDDLTVTLERIAA